MSSDTPSPESAQDIQVRLKPLFGVEPKHYLAVIYSVVVLALLFALLVGPGLSKPGTRVSFTSTPAGAEVRWGEKHWGTTPLTVFLPEGKATLTVSKPGFQPSVRDYSSGNNVFFSLFLPKTDKIDVKLEATSADSVASLYRAEIGRWALAAPFTSDYRFPPLFTRWAVDAQAAGLETEKINALLLDLRAAVADPQMYSDYGRALGLWKADAPVSLEAQFDLWAPLVGGPSDRLALWLLANQPKPVRDREVAEPSDWWKAKVTGFQTGLKAASTPAFGSVPGSLKAGGVSYRGVAPATFLWGSTGNSFSLPTEPPFELPVPVSTAAFWIADAEVTQAQFAAFAAAQPQWSPSARDELIAAGQADDGYLVDWRDGKPASPSAPVTGVSWYAAQAYTAWLNASGQAAGKKAVLPDDFQWEAAARSAAGAGMLNQGVWEWTASAWYPGQSLVWNAAAARDAQAYARSLKGGVQNAKGSVKAGDRAGWPAAGTTPGLGFRVALVSP
jgi:hypothetical protein